MIRARPRHRRSINALDAGRAEQRPDHDFAEDRGLPGARARAPAAFAAKTMREGDGYEEL
jgi:hypothetical protein